MYSPPSSQKKQAVKQVLIYVGMTATVLTVVFLLVLFTLGYRFDRSARTIEQGGLVQLNSIPSGASVMINAARVSGTTATKATLAPGQHTISMTRNGYHPWQKTVDVRRGGVLWLNYARLIPTNLPVENVLELPGAVSSKASPNRELYAMITEKSSSTIRLFTLTSSTPQSKDLVLPDGSYTKPEESAESTFRIAAWDKSSRYILIEHTYAESKEWIVVDSENIDRTENLTTTFSLAISDVQFSPEDSRVLYALISGDIRKLDLENSTISAPLAQNVTEFSFYENATIFFTTAIDEVTKTRNVGYVSEGAGESRVVRRYSDDGALPLHVVADKYYSQTYVAVAYGDTIEILSGPLPKSDSEATLSLTTIATVSTKEPIAHFSSRTNGRFFVAQHGRSYSVYDLELQKSSTTMLRGEGAMGSELGWIDNYIVWSAVDGALRLYEFDGANQHDIMPIVPGQSPVITPNNRFLYAPTADENGAYHLSRVRLIQ